MERARGSSCSMWAATNGYGIRLYSRIGPSQERQDAPLVTTSHLTQIAARCHNDCHNVCHTNCHSNCHSNSFALKSKPVTLRDTKLADSFKVREDNERFGFVHSIKTDAIFIAPVETIRTLSGLLERGVSEVTAAYPGLMEALTP